MTLDDKFPYKRPRIRARTRIKPPTVFFSMRYLQAGLKTQMKMLSIALECTMDEVANAALKIGVKAMQKRLIKDGKDDE